MEVMKAALHKTPEKKKRPFCGEAERASFLFPRTSRAPRRKISGSVSKKNARDTSAA